MTDEVIIEEKPAEPVVIPSPFSQDSWRSEPTTHVADVVVDEEKPPVDVTPVAPVAEAQPVVEEKPKEVPVIPAIEKFANEESETVYNLLLAGETDKVLDIYAEQKRLKEADKMPAVDRIKLAIQYSNKNFTASDVDDVFNDYYEFPDKPVKGEFEDDDEFKAKEDKYNSAVEKINRKIERDAKVATVDLQKISKEIVLPNITERLSTKVEPTQEELAEQQKSYDDFLKKVDAQVKSFNGYESTFKDEEVELKVGYKLTNEEKTGMQPLLTLAGTDAPAFLKSIGWLDEKGEINLTKITEDLPFITDKQKVLSKMISETGNQRYAEAKKTIKNIDYSGGKKGAGDMGESPEQLQGKMVSHFFSRQ